MYLIKVVKVAGILILLGLICGCSTPVPNAMWAEGSVVSEAFRNRKSDVVRVMKGGLVETLYLNEERSVNIQINKLKPRNYELDYPRVMTIGDFSKVWGSGFTSRKNIFFEKRISTYGQDSFMVDDVKYRVTWKRDDWGAASLLVSDIYDVLVEEY